jgi:hypothetical protein
MLSSVPLAGVDFAAQITAGFRDRTWDYRQYHAHLVVRSMQPRVSAIAEINGRHVQLPAKAQVVPEFKS